MHMLKDLLQGVEVRSVVGDKTVQVTDIEFDSRKVKSGSLFFATRGTQVDGHTYIPAAIAAGAVAVVCEELPAERPEGVTFVKVADSTVALGEMASAFYGYPSVISNWSVSQGPMAKLQRLRCFIGCSAIGL